MADHSLEQISTPRKLWPALVGIVVGLLSGIGTVLLIWYAIASIEMIAEVMRLTAFVPLGLGVLLGLVVGSAVRRDVTRYFDNRIARRPGDAV